MTTRRRPIRRDMRVRITPEAVALWMVLQELQDEGTEEEWEPTGRRREYLNASAQLNRLLGISPWERSPLDAPTAEPPPYLRHNELQLRSYRRAWQLRCDLMAAEGRWREAGRAAPRDS